MPLYIVADDGSLLGWGDTPSPTDDPPAAPTGVAIDAGDGQVTVSWDTPAEGDVTEHRVRRVNEGGSTTLVAIVPMPALSTVISELTNGTEYTYVVRAVDGAGQASGNSAQVSATPEASPVGTTTIFGYNTNESGAPLSSRLVRWSNRAPMVRRYLGSYLSSGTFGITTATAPEKRLAYSVKQSTGTAYNFAGLAAGAGNARLTSWVNSIPEGWTVYLTYYHEVNDDIRDGNITIQQYRDTYSHFRDAIDAATPQDGVTVKLCSNFMAYQVANTPAYFDDSWVPPEADLMTFDLYGNPGHFTSSVLTPNCPNATGPEYGASFPNIQTRWRDTLEAIVRNGFKDAWGIQELNTPPRDWDGPANPDYVCGTNKRLRYQGGRTASGHDTSGQEVERAAWITGSVDYITSNPTILGQTLGNPDHVLFWEHPEGVNWNQKFYTDYIWDELAPYVVNSP